MRACERTGFLQALGEWQRQHLARSIMRRLYCRRAFLGWLERVVTLRTMRAKLWHAARVLVYGSLARCFGTWWQYSQVRAHAAAALLRRLGRWWWW